MISWSWFTLSGQTIGIMIFVFFTILPWITYKFFQVWPLPHPHFLFFLGFCWATVSKSISLLPDKPAYIQVFVHSLLHTEPARVNQVMSFLGKGCFCANGHLQLWWLCHVIQNNMLTIYHSPAQLFPAVQFSFSALHQLEQLSHSQQALFLCNFQFPMWLLLQMPCPVIGILILRVLNCHYQLFGSWSGAMYWAYNALWELQLVAMMLHKISFQLSGKVVPLNLDNCTGKAYLCNQGGTVFNFSFQNSLPDIESDEQTQYYSYFSKHSYHSQCESQLSVMGWLLLELHLLPHIA